MCAFADHFCIRRCWFDEKNYDVIIIIIQIMKKEIISVMRWIFLIITIDYVNLRL